MLIGNEVGEHFVTDPHIKLRAQIRAARELMGKTQSEIASYLDVSLAKISKAETGSTKSGDVLLEIKKGLERLGIVFTRNGVEYAQGHIEIIEGQDCYLRLLDEVNQALAGRNDKELLIMFASDAVSPTAVNNKYRFMRSEGITMRQIIREGDSYIMGPLHEYKAIPEAYFSNVVTLIYGDQVAQVSGDATRVTIHFDALLAERERRVFSYFWDTGTTPLETTTMERF